MSPFIYPHCNILICQEYIYTYIYIHLSNLIKQQIQITADEVNSGPIRTTRVNPNDFGLAIRINCSIPI